MSWTSPVPTPSASTKEWHVTDTSVVVTPVQTIEYTLTATNVYGSTQAKVTVTVGALPTIEGFVANPNIEAGPGVAGLLSWSTVNATTVTIDNGVGQVATARSNFQVKPAKATIYTLTATNPVGSVTATATISLGP